MPMRLERMLGPGIAYLLAFLATLVVLFFLATSVRISRERALSDARLQVSGELGQLRSRLTDNIYLNANLVQGLAAAIATEPTMSQDRFSDLASYLFQGRNQLKNIGGAPDLVMRLMYPLKGNEAAIGLDFTKDEQQKKAALLARNTGGIVMAGPVSLRQGGRGFIARVPVFNAENAPQPGAFWGLISTVIDVEQLYHDSGLTDAEQSLEIAIRGKDGTGATGEFFYGDPAILAKAPVMATAVIPNGEWQLLAVPREGWPQRAHRETRIILTYLIGGALIVLPLLLVGHLLSQRRGFTRALIEAREKAEAANGAKSQFLASMSHELRTPMTGIMGIADLLTTTALSSQQSTMTHMLRQSAQTLLDLLNDILDLAKIEAGKMNLEMIDFDLSALLLELKNLFAPAMAEKGVEFIVEGAGEQGEVFRGDSKRIRQILYNLVGNALKFTDAGTVRVRHWQEPEVAGNIVLKFAVSDSGIGISEDGLSRLFQKFEQEDPSTARRYGGTGLGLAICKQLSEAMGGGIGVESVKGKGSTFAFWIRIAAGDINKSPAATVVTPSQVSQALAGLNLNILLAEDNETTQFIVKQMLSKWGHRVTVVGDGQQAIDTASGKNFDIILMDMQMPVIDGQEAVRHIRSGGGKSAATPIIALTADGIVEHHKQYLDAGCNVVATKPVVWAVLANEIKALISDRLVDPVENNGSIVAKHDFAPVLNTEMIAMLQEIFSADDFAKMLWRVLGSVTDYKARLESDIAGGDHKQAKRTAHTLKGLCSQVGADEVAAAARCIEEEFADIHEIKRAMLRLEDSIERLRIEIQKRVPQ